MMTVAGICWSLALVAVVGAGLSTIVGLRSLQERFARIAIVTGMLGLASPVAGNVLTMIGGFIPTLDMENWFPSSDAWLLALIVIGHITFLVFLIHRRRRQSRRGSNDHEDMERARTRRRSRLSPDGEEQ
jgi:MFS family permease